VNAWVRRYFIKKFLEADVARSQGTDYNPRQLIAADRFLADYFAWLNALHGVGGAGVLPAFESSAPSPWADEPCTHDIG
jgi:hypothetical protein